MRDSAQGMADSAAKGCLASRYRTVIQARSAELSHQQPQKEQSYKTGQDEHLGILPPHLTSRRPGASPESSRLTSHDVRLINEQLYPFTSAQDLLYILDHDVFHMIQLVLSSSKLIERWGGVERVHKVGDCWTKASLHSICR